ncbi:MAG: hypothetical protein G3M78_05500 [Candidatus Nitrohelix vancouverensis]|uniref:Uncharacterized protein n=1 Tax=Candidatus Nitrohelix vancouverensis TaxID=2705534 RepID=A0A7T0C1M7_9BACT|nr:MAG: hypothetical protein G3M78_05500 [Candidatus Nitrohelix vancouverensis]
MDATRTANINPIEARAIHMEESIKHNLRKNGFPAKAVRLPFKSVYDACKKRDIALQDVLDRLKDDHIFSFIEGNHILFKCTPEKPESAKPQATPASGGPEGWNAEQLQKMAQEQMASLSPEQMEEIRKTVESMSEEEKRNLMEMAAKQFRPGN